MDSTTVWNGQDPTLSGQDDFQQFLDMSINNLGDNLPYDFHDFQQVQNSQMMHTDHRERMDTGMEHVQNLIGADTTMQESLPPITTTTSYPSKDGQAIAHGQPSSESLVELDAQIHFLQHQRHQQQQRELQEQQRNYYAQQRMIPPTPNSIEMHSATSQFYAHSAPGSQILYDRYQMQIKEQEMAFTPLVSPAVTPLESHFSIPEYTVPGAYFSPLSSPALHAQSEHSSVYDHRLSGTTNSPVDMGTDSHSAPASSIILTKRPGKKPPPPKPRSTRSVRQSPIAKAKKAKRNSVSGISSHVLGDILEPTAPQVEKLHPASSSHSAASTEESENDSISPEHLSGMAPPPIPTTGSAGTSPYVHAQNEKTKARLSLGSPATPASLMRLTQSPQANQPFSVQNSMELDDTMDGFALPEPATSTVSARPQLSRIETPSDGQTTPTLSSTNLKGPFQPLPSPSLARPRTSKSTSQSPQIDSLNGLNTSRKTPTLAARGTKKRASSSVLVSPALLPRISPSIKPLLPGGGKVTEDTASLLLASKSNYQNILEGTHLPGVSYPTELSTNLTSKRTSHKIAEQGRRNRINSALQEIATLLPRGQAKDSGCDKSSSGEGVADNNDNGIAKSAAQSANSKASTVEQAIEYIKQLKKEVEEANQRAEKAEKELQVNG